MKQFKNNRQRTLLLVFAITFCLLTGCQSGSGSNSVCSMPDSGCTSNAAASAVISSDVPEADVIIPGVMDVTEEPDEMQADDGAPQDASGIENPADDSSPNEADNTHQSNESRQDSEPQKDDAPTDIPVKTPGKDTDKQHPDEQIDASFPPSASGEDKENGSNNEPLPTYEAFGKEIGMYNAGNQPYKDWKGDTQQAAWIEVYSVEKSDDVSAALTSEFEDFYGFAPTASVVCEDLGTYMVEGYSEPQSIYHYTITDKTYIYITNPMYTVYSKATADGSVWVGFCICGTMDSIGSEATNPEVQALYTEMYALFEEKIGLSMDEIREREDELDIRIGYISQAGTVRTADGVVDALYVYCRGFPAN